MTRFELMTYSGVIKEYKPMNWRRRIACNRRINRALRYVCPKDKTFKAFTETLFWLAAAGLAATCVIAFPVMFVRWWMGA